MQEEVLQFNHFTNEDAWELGLQLVAEAKRRGAPVVVKIERNNGQTAFQYESTGTTLYSEMLAEKKIRTSRLLERSTLSLELQLQDSDEKQEDLGLSDDTYAAVGGAFPIRVEEVGVVAVAAVSSGNSVADHDVLIRTIGRYLHVDEVPRITQL